MIKKTSLLIILSVALLGCGGSNSNSSNSVEQNTSSPPTTNETNDSSPNDDIGGDQDTSNVPPISSTPLDNGGDQDTSNVPPIISPPLDSKFYGRWSLVDIEGEELGLSYLALSRHTLTSIFLDTGLFCFDSELFLIDSSTEASSSTETSVTLTNIETDEQSTLNLELLDDGTLIAADEDTIASFISSDDDFNPPSPGCESLYGVKQVEIDLALSYLPPYITLNRNAQMNGFVEYSYAINFDINRNNMMDSGDITIEIYHFKGDAAFSNNHNVSVAALGAKIWSYFGSTNRSTSDADNSIVQVIQTDNILTFKFDITQNPLLAHLNEDTPVQVQTYLSYPEPEREVIAGWQDGPWNWLGARHADDLPKKGFLQPNHYSDMLIDDTSMELTEGESKWVDIKSVQFKFTKN